MSYQQESTDTIRRDQIEQARALAAQEGAERKVISLPTGARSPRSVQMQPRSATGAPHKKNVLKGHESFLKALEMNGARIEIEKKDGTIYRGVLKHTDKYTLTVNVTERGHVDNTGEPESIPARDRVIFKHDMSEFSALTQRAKSADAEGNQ